MRSAAVVPTPFYTPSAANRNSIAWSDVHKSYLNPRTMPSVVGTNNQNTQLDHGFHSVNSLVRVLRSKMNAEHEQGRYNVAIRITCPYFRQLTSHLVGAISQLRSSEISAVKKSPD